MDSSFQSGSNRRDRVLEFESECGDITSLVFHLSSKDRFDLTVHKRSDSRTCRKMDTIPPLELPAPAMSNSPAIGFGDSSFGDSGRLRVDFPSGDRENAPENGVPMAGRCQANAPGADLDPVLNVKIHANFGLSIEFSARGEKVHLQINPEHQTEKNQNVDPGPLLNGFDDKLLDAVFNVNKSGQNTDFAESLEANQDLQMLSQDTALSSSNFNYLYDVEASPIILSDSADIGFPSNEFNFSDSASRPIQEIFFSSAWSSSSSSANLTAATSPSTAATTPSILSSSPDGHFCPLCHSTFTRPSDLKRHEGVHFPEQRRYHCKQLGCERTGRKGFYRRDKLRTHERQVHGLDD